MANKRPRQSPDFIKVDSQGFSVFLQELLTEIGWSQKKLADRAGLSTTMVSRIVNNRNSRNGEFNLEFDMIVRLVECKSEGNINYCHKMLQRLTAISGPSER